MVLKGKAEDGMIDAFGNRRIGNSVICLYNTLIEYAMYWHQKTPTAFGNPEYNRLQGWVYGFVSAKNWEIKEKSNKIIITTRSGKKLIELETKPLPKSYFDAKKEINKTWNDILS